jgi:hypothetical protein
VNISLKRSRFFGGESREREERRVEEGEKEKERRRKGEKKGERVGVEEETENILSTAGEKQMQSGGIFFFMHKNKRRM